MNRSFTCFITLIAMLGMHSQSYAKCKKAQKDDSTKLAAKIKDKVNLSSVSNLEESIALLDEFLSTAKSDNQEAFILKVKSRLFREYGQQEAAVDTYKKVLELDDVSFATRAQAHAFINAYNRPTNEAAKNIKPKFRKPAGMPPRAFKSGFSGQCNFIFDIDEMGKTTNIDVYLCTAPLFKTSTRQAIEDWTYEPPMQAGVPAIATGISSSMTFITSDKKGKKCPLKKFDS